MLLATVDIRRIGDGLTARCGDIIAVRLSDATMAYFETLVHQRMEWDDLVLEAALNRQRQHGTPQPVLATPYAGTAKAGWPIRSTRFVDMQAMPAAWRKQIRDGEFAAPVVPWAIVSKCIKMRDV